MPPRLQRTPSSALRGPRPLRSSSLSTQPPLTEDVAMHSFEPSLDLPPVSANPSRLSTQSTSSTMSDASVDSSASSSSSSSLRRRAHVRRRSRDDKPTGPRNSQQLASPPPSPPSQPQKPYLFPINTSPSSPAPPPPIFPAVSPGDNPCFLASRQPSLRAHALAVKEHSEDDEIDWDAIVHVMSLPSPPVTPIVIPQRKSTNEISAMLVERWQRYDSALQKAS
ncbi:hypothetical protein SISSUDRAFT_1043218 [Sistotremastrum suecicum HHB10207 ss-3]|uniref:Uncharacterized protein n=1 Tax=Sistotremastrum suecicum HHB10207 ss-3 TaxID=1314776 RepID=A0A166FYW7_9AGAM|nr:hypothetical protein SISSUDRAFT_1043218 [Sistotremastrum suecicum HHB10207 ss-3]